MEGEARKKYEKPEIERDWGLTTRRYFGPEKSELQKKYRGGYWLYRHRK